MPVSYFADFIELFAKSAVRGAGSRAGGSSAPPECIAGELQDERFAGLLGTLTEQRKRASALGASNWTQKRSAKSEIAGVA